MPRNVIALDLREDVISAVRLSGSLKGYGVDGCWQRAVPPIESGADPDGSRFREALGALVADIGPSDATYVAALPPQWVTFRNIRVPFRRAKSIRQILPFELEPHLPFTVDDASIDFNSFRLDGRSASDHTDLVTATIQRQKIRHLLDILAASNIRPQLISVGSLPAVAWLAQQPKSAANWLFADIEAGACTVFVIAEGQICQIRSFPIDPGVSDFEDALGTQILQTVWAFEDAYDVDLNPALLTIGRMPPGKDGIAEDLARRLKLPAAPIDLAREARIALPDAPHGGPAEPQVFHHPLALALVQSDRIKTIDFQSGPFSDGPDWSALKGRLSVAAVLAGIVLSLFWINLKIETTGLSDRVARLNRQVSAIFTQTLPDAKRMVDPVHQIRLEIQEIRRSADTAEYEQNRPPVIDILNDVSRLISPEIRVDIDKLVVGPDSVTLSGQTDSFNSVDAVKNRLDSGSLFERVNISSANIDKSGQNVRFKMLIALFKKDGGDGG